VRKRLLLPLLFALLVVPLAVAPATAGARAAKAKHASGRLKVNLAITRFDASSRKSTADGVATATLTDSTGQAAHIKQHVHFAVKSGGGCQILGLVLDQLNLKLLGLNVKLDKVNLQITGKRSGGVLGKLFCRLANSDVKAKRVSAARALTKVAHRRPMRPLVFEVGLRPVTAAQSTSPTCKVLTLVLGPLNLNLLGLVVDLNKVNLAITATRGEGALGDLFCQLADNNTSSGGA
jgi:hypothetical protein